MTGICTVAGFIFGAMAQLTLVEIPRWLSLLVK